MSKLVMALTSVRPDGQKALEAYLAVVGPLMDKAGARLVSRYQTSENLSKTDMPEFVSVVEYPDMGAIRMVFEAPEYLALRPTREAAFSRYDICVLESV